jgi:ferredoxin-NADP reductase
VRHFIFEVPAVDKLTFAPGQFVSFTDDVKGRSMTRAYSICSRPDSNRFELCLNLVDEGVFSSHLFTLRPGDAIPMQQPLGYFTLRDPVSDSVLVATGTGIAPFRSMLADLLPRDSTHRFTLIFGARHERGLLYREEWEALARKHPNFQFWPTLSRPEPSWTGRTGHVQPYVREAVGDRRDLDIYICGLKRMVDDVRAMLKNLGFDRRRLVYEKYD